MKFLDAIKGKINYGTVLLRSSQAVFIAYTLQNAVYKNMHKVSTVLAVKIRSYPKPRGRTLRSDTDTCLRTHTA
jgi:hypothetical protein